MLWLNKHARFRHSLSPYVDGRLTPVEVARLEGHLDSCDAFRRELDELRATASALRALPDVEAPRSFVLTPQMLERSAVTPVASAPPLAIGMRLASAAVAVVLAVVVIGDLSDAGNGGNGGREAASEQADSRTTAEFAAAGEEPSPGALSAPAATGIAEDAGSDTAEQAPSPTPAPPRENVSVSCPSGGAAGPASGGGAGGPGAPGATPTVTPSTETPLEAAAVEAGAACDESVVGAAAPEVTATPEGVTPPADEGLAEQAAAAEDDGGGISALRVLELALAGSLFALLAAVAVEFALRHQKVSKREPY